MSSDIKEKGQKNKIMPNERKSTFISFCKVLYVSACIAMAICLLALTAATFWELDQTQKAGGPGLTTSEVYTVEETENTMSHFAG